MHLHVSCVFLSERIYIYLYMVILSLWILVGIHTQALLFSCICYDLFVDVNNMTLIFDFPTSLCGVLVLRFAPAAPATPSAAAPPRLSLSHLTPHMALTPTHTPSFTHNFVTHHLWHTIFHTPSQTIFHTPSFTYHFVTHHLWHTIFHTQLWHTIFHTSFRPSSASS